MNKYKKTLLTIFAFTTSPIYAGTMGPVCVEGNPTLPCTISAWEIGAQALYLKPTYSNGFMTSHYYNPISNTTKWNVPDPKWGWGFKIAGAYYYSTGSDISLNWYHINPTTSNYPLITSPATGLTYSVTTLMKPRWDAVNGEFGQVVKFGDVKKIRFFGGAQYAQIISNFDTPSSTFALETLYMKFLGFGPRIGADMSYDWGYGLSLYANGASALLVGGSKFNDVTTGLTATTGNSYMPYTTIVVPEIEGKLGATYNYALEQGNLSLDVGYLWQNYIHSQSFFTMVGNGTTSDFMLNGPYVGLKWLG